MFLLKREYFNKTIIIKGLYNAILLSAFIYLSHFNFEYKFIHTILALLGLYNLLTCERKTLFFTGFFVGIFWFYWVSFSFVYYNLSYLIPLMILLFALAYGFLFLATSIINNIYFRAFAFISLSYIAPFGFNWFKSELLLINSYFEPSKLSLLLLLIATVLLTKQKKMLYALVILITFIMGYNIDKKDASMLQSDLNISMPTFNLNQEYKWNRNNQSKIVRQNLNIIDKAIEEGKDLVILPETAFPLVLNADKMLLDVLKEKSQNIAIIAGSLYKNNVQYNNSTYLFQKGKIDVAHKVVLVPFGEAIPMPKFIRDFINNTFYDGAQDYQKADKPTDFLIDGTLFRNAICYEATHDDIYKNLNGVEFLIATSNNAWFTPSIEPTLQKLLMAYYAKKYNVIIYHVVNGSQNALIRP